MKLLILSSKGGVGKTTIATGLASVAALRRDLSTLVVEADQQLSAHFYLQHVNEVDNAFIDTEDLARAVRKGSSDHEVCIYDVPPRHEYRDIYLEAAESADFTLVPFQPAATTTDSVKTFLRGLRDRAPGRYATVLNGIDSSTFSYTKQKALLNSMSEAGVPVLEATLKQRAVWSNITHLEDRSLIHHAANGLARLEIENVYSEIEKLTGRTS